LQQSFFVDGPIFSDLKPNVSFQVFVNCLPYDACQPIMPLRHQLEVGPPFVNDMCEGWRFVFLTSLASLDDVRKAIIEGSLIFEDSLPFLLSQSERVGLCFLYLHPFVLRLKFDYFSTS
jgi:hypothetical protein